MIFCSSSVCSVKHLSCVHCCFPELRDVTTIIFHCPSSCRRRCTLVENRGVQKCFPKNIFVPKSRGKGTNISRNFTPFLSFVAFIFEEGGAYPPLFPSLFIFERRKYFKGEEENSDNKLSKVRLAYVRFA